MGLEISPMLTTFCTGSFVFLSSISMFYFGLSRKHDIRNENHGNDFEDDGDDEPLDALKLQRNRR